MNEIKRQKANLKQSQLTAKVHSKSKPIFNSDFRKLYCDQSKSKENKVPTFCLLPFEIAF